MRSAEIPTREMLSLTRRAALTSLPRTLAARTLCSRPQGVWVTVDVPDDAKAEFLKVMEADVLGSRDEPGCMRFDLLDQGNGRYSFYEIYQKESDMATHKTLPHYLGWAEFKKRNPAVAKTQTVLKFALHEPK